ncbi:MAG: histidine phosphatase family protein [Candidatus Vogelbacteria bacterium]|nr:histidine phosphatase family protein [Candidatus Vogelbacteria bacterium]
MKIYLVRHGETDSNKNHIHMGRIDEPLNENGINQANIVADEFKDGKIDLIFCSPLKRATQTARIIGKRINVPVIEQEELFERDYGELSGSSYDYFKTTLVNGRSLFEADLAQEYDYRPYGGESVEDVKQRLGRFVSEIKEQYSDKKILVVAHGGILKLAHLLYHEKTMETPHNCKVIEVEI